MICKRWLVLRVYWLLRGKKPLSLGRKPCFVMVNVSRIKNQGFVGENQNIYLSDRRVPGDLKALGELKFQLETSAKLCDFLTFTIYLAEKGGGTVYHLFEHQNT